jgi:hypothetical protein
MTKEFGFFDGFWEYDVFGFHDGECNGDLLIRLPGNGIICEEEDIARDWFAVVGVCCKACIAESGRYRDRDGRGRRSVECNDEIFNALDIA